MNARCAGWWIGWGCLVWAASAVGQPECTDPVFVQIQARIAELPTGEEQVRAWKEFLADQPQSPCAGLARRRIADLEDSERLARERQERERWQQEARGGVVEPNRDEFAEHQVLPDAWPVDRVRVLSEAIWLGTGFKSDRGAENLRLKVDREALWTLVLRSEVALVSHLAIDLDVPLVLGQISGERFDAALGNIALGIRGIWGQRIGAGLHPWVIAGGVVWGSGSSVWMGADSQALLDSAAVSAAHFRHLFRYDSPDYALRLASHIGLGDHGLALALTYHVYAGGEHVEKILRFDLAWDWRPLRWLTLGVELNGGVGDAEAVVGATANEQIFFLLVSPGLRLESGRWSAGLALRAPLADAWNWTRLITALELSVRL